MRNPILVSFIAKGLLPYQGLGSGIQRALNAWPSIDLINDQIKAEFHVVIYRKKRYAPINAPIQDQIIKLMQQTPEVSYDELAEILDKNRSTIMRHINVLKQKKIIERIGSNKTGHWRIL